jgi:DNA-binding transcriptional MerR regulator
MNDLIEIYRRIEYLRNNGLKMKEIADYVDMAPMSFSSGIAFR